MQNTMTSPPLAGMANLLEMQGRMGDTELVHMSKPEVKGLQSLGQLTRNPETGLLEAFSIGGFFRDYVVPAALFAIPGVGPYAAAAYTGIKTGIQTGDPLAGATSALVSFGAGKLGGKLFQNVFGADKALSPGAESFKSAMIKGSGAGGQKALQQGLTEAGKGANPFITPLTSQSGLGTAISGPNIPIGSFQNVPVGERVGSLFGGAAAKGPLETFSGMSTRSLGQQFMKNLAKPETAIRGLTSGIVSDLTRPPKAPEMPQVRKTEVRDTGYGTRQLNMNPRFQVGAGPTAQDLEAAATGKIDPIQYYNPEYLSTMVGKKGGIIDALESITEGMEDLAKVSDGEIEIQGTIKAAQEGGLMGMQPFEGRVMGQGDGMSDEIPFSIEGQQPALLSRDEYVIPADVVSALGNGSSNAGADKLDGFLTDVREKVMGRQRQINQIG